jgi:hypothetical protein
VLDVITIAALRFIFVNELSPTINTEMILLLFFLVIFANVAGLAFGIFYKKAALAENCNGSVAYQPMIWRKCLCKSVSL